LLCGASTVNIDGVVRDHASIISGNIPESADPSTRRLASAPIHLSA
jgi:hypothetical protein